MKKANGRSSTTKQENQSLQQSIENQGLPQSMVVDSGLFIPLFLLLSLVRLRTVVLLLFLPVLLRQFFGVVLRTAAVRRAVVRLAV
jgi:hypothetical protein